jgi:hypothetical protein
MRPIRYAPASAAPADRDRHRSAKSHLHLPAVTSTPTMPILTRRTAIAVLPMLAACGTTRVPPLDQPPRGRVVVLRGLFNMFSTGMNVLTFTLRQDGYDATVHNHAEWRSLADRTAAAAQTDALKRPLAVIGHSFGADDAILLTGRLADAGVPVDLLVTFDPAWVLNVPRGPRKVINFHQDRDTFIRRLSPAAGFDGRIENRQVSGDSHLSIDKNPALHNEVRVALVDIAGPPAPPIVSATPRPAVAPGTLPRPPAPPVRAGR